MPRRTTTFDLALPLREEGTPAYRWLYDALRALILGGRRPSGARLPGTRDLAAQYGLSRGTVVSAFEQLKSEGYVEGTVGSGTYVSRTLPDELLQVPRTPRRQPQPRTEPPRRLSAYARQIALFPALEGGSPRAFRSNRPALDLFPTGLWAQVAARRLRKASSSLLLGCSPLGYRPLQEAVADYLSASRGVKCGPEQVVIVSGVQEALDLTARLFLNPGDTACIEDPGYPGAAIAFEAAGARVRPVPVDTEGLVVRGRVLHGSRLAYVTPAHQFPLGMTMTLSRRLELLEWARTTGGLIFEDDYDSEYRYSGRPIPALQGLDTIGCVLFAGSFNKVLFPSLRSGYLVVPEDLVDCFGAARSATVRHPPLLEQAVLHDFISQGHFARHLRRMRGVYAERLSTLLEAARERLGEWLEVSPVEAGLQTAGWLRDGIDAESVAGAAARRGVEVTSLARHARGGARREGLQLGFAAVDPAEIRRGVRELAAAIHEVARTLRSPRGARGSRS